ncbi:MAG: RAD55 family ATPase [Thermoplasmata archaeon]|nr:RAD55 family ATPase [Thermoplasmata archaeon]
MAVELPSAPVSVWVAPSHGLTPASNQPAPSHEPRVPTGIADFDQMSGGLPAGSVVLLLGETGAGHQEFALTSATHLMFHYDEERLHKFYLALDRENYVYPRAVAYVSLTRSKEQLLQEVSGSFDPLYRTVFERHLEFHDLSAAYFAETIVPPSWSATPGGLLAAAAAPASRGEGPLAALAGALEEGGPGNVVVVDSLTDLLVRRGIEASDLLTLVKGLRRRAKSWGGIVYLLLSRGVVSADTEQGLADSVDGVLSFSWNQNPLRSSRQRSMLVAKSMPVLAHVPHEHQGRFVIRISSLTGLVTTQYERI